MSFRIMTRVWATNLEPSAKLVLFALADHANKEGKCWPSIDQLALKTGLSSRTVQRVIPQLCEADHISRVEVPGRGCRYQVHPRHDVTPLDGRKGRHDVTPPVPGCHPSGDMVSPHPRHGVTQTYQEPTNNRPRTRTRARGEAGQNRKSKSGPLPVNWQPDTADKEMGAIVAAWPRERFERELRQFKDHAAATDRWLVDWQAGFRTWLRNARDPDATRESGRGLFNASHGDGR